MGCYVPGHDGARVSGSVGGGLALFLWRGWCDLLLSGFDHGLLILLLVGRRRSISGLQTFNHLIACGQAGLINLL